MSNLNKYVLIGLLGWFLCSACTSTRSLEGTWLQVYPTLVHPNALVAQLGPDQQMEVTSIGQEGYFANKIIKGSFTENSNYLQAKLEGQPAPEDLPLSKKYSDSLIFGSTDQGPLLKFIRLPQHQAQDRHPNKLQGKSFAVHLEDLNDTLFFLSDSLLVVNSALRLSQAPYFDWYRKDVFGYRFLTIEGLMRGNYVIPGVQEGLFYQISYDGLNKGTFQEISGRQTPDMLKNKWQETMRSLAGTSVPDLPDFMKNGEPEGADLGLTIGDEYILLRFDGEEVKFPYVYDGVKNRIYLQDTQNHRWNMYQLVSITSERLVLETASYPGQPGERIYFKAQ